MCQKQSDFPRYQKILVPFMIVAFILATFLPSVAAEKKPAERGWEFQVAPYIWAISMKGNVTVKGLEADADVGFKDIWDELNFAVMVAYEARKKHWGLWGNTIYAHLGDSDVEGPLGLTKIDPTVSALWQGLGATYRLGAWDLAYNSGKKRVSVTVDTFAGARYTYLNLEIDFKGVFQGRFNKVDKNKSWVEPLIGAKTIWDLSERWTVTLAGDIGGVVAGSDFAWNAWGLIGYRFSLLGEDNARVLVGYRALYQDYTDGSGRDKFQWDVTIHGPILGLSIGF